MLLAMGDIYIQILFSGYNLILVKAFGCGKSYCRNLILAIVLEWKQKDFLYLDYFLILLGVEAV